MESMEMAETGDQSPAVWNSAEYELSDVIANLLLPQTVKVVEGIMFSEDNFVSSDTVLTLHGLKTITKLKGFDEKGREIYIPLNCHNQVKIISSHYDTPGVSFHKVKDLCHHAEIPRYVRPNRKFTHSKVVIYPGTILEVNGVTFSKTGKVKGLKVKFEISSDADGRKICEVMLRVDTVGDFTPCLPPDYEGRRFFIKELVNFSCFPISIEFTSVDKEYPMYGPQLGKVHLEGIKAVEVVLASTEFDGVRNALTFPRNIPLTVNVSCGVMQSSKRKSMKVCHNVRNEVEFQIIEDKLLHANPHAGFHLYETYEKSTVLDLNSNSVQTDCCTDTVSSRNSQKMATIIPDVEPPPAIIPRTPQKSPSKPPSRQPKSILKGGNQSMMKQAEQTSGLPPRILPRRPVPIPNQCPSSSGSKAFTSKNTLKTPTEDPAQAPPDASDGLDDDDDNNNNNDDDDDFEYFNVKVQDTDTSYSDNEENDNDFECMDAAITGKSPGYNNECQIFTEPFNIQSKPYVTEYPSDVGYIFMTDTCNRKPVYSAKMSQSPPATSTESESTKQEKPPVTLKLSINSTATCQGNRPMAESPDDDSSYEDGYEKPEPFFPIIPRNTSRNKLFKAPMADCQRVDEYIRPTKVSTSPPLSLEIQSDIGYISMIHNCNGPPIDSTTMSYEFQTATKSGSPALGEPSRKLNLNVNTNSKRTSHDNRLTAESSDTAYEDGYEKAEPFFPIIPRNSKCNILFLAPAADYQDIDEYVSPTNASASPPSSPEGNSDYSYTKWLPLKPGQKEVHEDLENMTAESTSKTSVDQNSDSLSRRPMPLPRSVLSKKTSTLNKTVTVDEKLTDTKPEVNYSNTVRRNSSGKEGLETTLQAKVESEPEYLKPYDIIIPSSQNTAPTPPPRSKVSLADKSNNCDVFSSTSTIVSSSSKLDKGLPPNKFDSKETDEPYYLELYDNENISCEETASNVSCSLKSAEFPPDENKEIDKKNACVTVSAVTSSDENPSKSQSQMDIIITENEQGSIKRLKSKRKPIPCPRTKSPRRNHPKHSSPRLPAKQVRVPIARDQPNKIFLTHEEHCGKTQYLELPSSPGSSKTFCNIRAAHNSAESIKNQNESQVCELLDYLMLSDFKKTFKSNQINGELLTCLSLNTLVQDLEMSRFQAMKLNKYIHGWRPKASDTTEVCSDIQDPTGWSVHQVYTKMKSLNLESLAEFCRANQVDGNLMNSILHEDILQCIMNEHNVKMSEVEQIKLFSFVMKNWRSAKLKDQKFSSERLETLL